MIFFGDQQYSFFIEVLIRTVTTFLAIIILLRLTGKRGVKQLSIFEMVIIIALGSAAGDSMTVKDVALSHTLFIFGIVLMLYRLLVLLVTKSEKAEKYLGARIIHGSWQRVENSSVKQSLCRWCCSLTNIKSFDYGNEQSQLYRCQR